jgi:hypothetical protein
MGRNDDDEGFDVGEVRCGYQTGASIKCRMLEDMPYMKKDDEFWVPISQIHDDSEVYQEGDEGQLKVTTWLAKERGWEDE